MKKEMALKAFNLRGWIDGCESGGIEPVKTITKVSIAKESIDDDIVDIEYTYPATCGLSDVRYHVVDHGKTFHEKYRIIGDRIYYMNSEGFWDGELFDNWLKMPEIDQKIKSFYKEFNLHLPTVTRKAIERNRRNQKSRLIADSL